MSHAASAWAIKQRPKNATEKMVLMALADAHNGQTGQCNPSIPKIAEIALAHEATVYRVISSLEQQGFIKRSGRFNGSTQYRLLIADPSHSATLADCDPSQDATLPLADCEVTPRTVRPKPGRNQERTRKGSAIPEDFTPTNQMLEWAKTECPSVNPSRETQKFIDYHAAKGSKFKSHQAAWRTWMRRAQEYATKDAPRKNGGLQEL